MKRKLKVFSELVIALFISPLLFAQTSTISELESCIPCESLKDLIIPDVVVSEATRTEDPVPHCKVLGIIGTEIKFELSLPDLWNNRYVMGGNGGFAGTLGDFLGNRQQVSKGYAVGLTDTGHEGSIWKADWALNNRERQVNFAHLAVHRVAVVSKEIIRQYYGSAPMYSYFHGCSKGGAQAMIEAQRYPYDFDGIVAGDPGISWPEFSAAWVYNGKTMYPDPDNLKKSLISKTHLEILQNTILEQCDALDGVKDGILNDPTVCDFDFDRLPRCPENEISDSCFTTAQIEGIKKIYEGLNVENEIIHPGYPYGCEDEGDWSFFIVDPDASALDNLGYPTVLFAFAVDVFKYLIFQDPDWDYRSYDFSNLKKDTRYLSSYLDATSTNYSALKDRGGKMILYHGWNDAAQSAYTTIEHYEAARNIDPQLSDYIRLFLLPGVLHCGGGPGPDELDWIELVRDWVEKGIPPERVVLTKSHEGKTTLTRPVFPYPFKAIYDEKGDPNKESSFIKSTTTYER